MNITPITMAKPNAVQTTRQNKAQYAGTLNDSVNFTGNRRNNGFIRAIAGLLATFGIATAVAPTARAFTPAPGTSSSYTEKMPLPMPTIAKEDLIKDPNYVDISVYNTSPYSYAQMPIEERLEELLPAANKKEDSDDLIVTQMKQVANVAVLIAEANSARSVVREAENAIKELQGKVNTATNKEAVEAAIAALNTRKSQATEYAMVLITVAYGTAQDMAETSAEMKSPSRLPVPPVQRPVYPNIDTVEDLRGYDQYMCDYVYNLIPDYANMPQENRNAILLAEAAKLRAEADLESERADMLKFITEQVNIAYQSEKVGTKYFLNNIIMTTATAKKSAERLSTIASKLEGIVSGDYKLSAPQYPPLPGGTIPKEETTDTKTDIPSTPSKPKDEVIGCTFEDVFGIPESVPSANPIPTPLPPTEVPVIGCSYEDIFGRPYEGPSSVPTPLPPTEVPVIGCTFEDIFGMTYEEFQQRFGDKDYVEISEN